VSDEYSGSYHSCSCILVVHCTASLLLGVTVSAQCISCRVILDQSASETENQTCLTAPSAIRASVGLLLGVNEK